MNVKAGVCFFVWMCAFGAVGQQQQPGLQRRDQQEKRDSAVPPPRAAMKVPEKLEPARTPNANYLSGSARKLVSECARIPWQLRAVLHDVSHGDELAGGCDWRSYERERTGIAEDKCVADSDADRRSGFQHRGVQERPE